MARLIEALALIYTKIVWGKQQTNHVSTVHDQLVLINRGVYFISFVSAGGVGGDSYETDL